MLDSLERSEAASQLIQYQYWVTDGQQLQSNLQNNILLHDAETYQVILEPVDQDERFRLLQIRFFEKCRTPLQEAAVHKNVDIMEAIRSSLSHGHWIYLLSMPFDKIFGCIYDAAIK